MKSCNGYTLQRLAALRSPSQTFTNARPSALPRLPNHATQPAGRPQGTTAGAGKALGAASPAPAPTQPGAARGRYLSRAGAKVGGRADAPLPPQHVQRRSQSRSLRERETPPALPRRRAGSPEGAACAEAGSHERGAGCAVGGQRCPLRHLPAVSVVALPSP